jgi:hypothetical protein
MARIANVGNPCVRLGRKAGKTMQRKGIRIGLALLAVLVVAATGCKKKESKPEKDKGKEPARKARPSDPDKGKAGARPGTDARKGPGLAFPELKPVPPPKGLESPKGRPE